MLDYVISHIPRPALFPSICTTASLLYNRQFGLCYLRRVLFSLVMPKSVVRELVEDSEEEQTQRTRRKSANKDDHEESSMDVDQTKKDEEEDEEEEEEYEIEQIIEFKAGVFDGACFHLSQG